MLLLVARVAWSRGLGLALVAVMFVLVAVAAVAAVAVVFRFVCVPMRLLRLLFCLSVLVLTIVC